MSCLTGWKLRNLNKFFQAGVRVDLKDLPALLGRIRDAAANAVTPAATAMASGFQDRVTRVTLRETFHPPGEFYKQVPGHPPAYASGSLARSIFMTPAHGSIRASASVGTTLKYAAIQEWGGWTEPRTHKFMHWRNPMPWWKKRVVIPEHPYFRPTTEAMIRDGSLTRLAMDAFYKEVRPYLGS